MKRIDEACVKSARRVRNSPGGNHLVEDDSVWRQTALGAEQEIYNGVSFCNPICVGML